MNVWDYIGQHVNGNDLVPKEACYEGRDELFPFCPMVRSY